MKYRTEIVSGAWGAAAGAIILAILGFTWFGWITGGTAEKMAQERADSAVVAALTPICIEKFKESEQAAQNLEALKKISYSWERGTFVEKGGWATFPGNDKPNSDVARACADALSKQKL
jgi:hypothetical protein